MKLVILLSLISFGTLAQEEKIIMEPITILFDGMMKGDSAMVHKSFMPNAKLYTVTESKEGKPVLRGDDITKFLVAIGTPHKEVWNELTWSPRIAMDGNMAQVWVPYAFYAGKTFSHCGIDAFQLFKNADGKWKIFHLADTRHKEGCQVPEEIKARMK